VKKSFYLLIIAIVTPLLGGCLDNGSTADPPADLAATAGDGRVMLTWTANPGVDYWLFTATDPSLTAFNWINLPNAHASTRVSSPYYVCNLFSGTKYFYAMNARTGGGPGGASSTTKSATPYDASAAWVAPAPPINGVPVSTNLNGVGYTSLTTCSNNATSATGSFAAVGAGGAIFTSSDGKTWADHTSTSPITSDLYAVTGYAANQNYPSNPALRWVAVGAGGVSVYSLDGTSWAIGRPENLASPYPALRSITHVSGTFFAVGDAGTILSSADGISWTPHVSGTLNNLNGVTHGTIYVAVGDSGTILTSGDGNTWTTRTSGTTNRLRQVTSFGKVYVAVGDAGTIVTSKDGGVTWMLPILPGTPTTGLFGVTAELKLVANALPDPELGYISFAQFVAVDSAGNTYTSPNGIIWSSATSTGISPTNALVSSGFGYVAAGNAGATAYAF
jgi:hypothetical protein